MQVTKYPVMSYDSLDAGGQLQHALLNGLAALQARQQSDSPVGEPHPELTSSITGTSHVLQSGAADTANDYMHAGYYPPSRFDRHGEHSMAVTSNSSPPGLVGDNIELSGALLENMEQAISQIIFDIEMPFDEALIEPADISAGGSCKGVFDTPLVGGTCNKHTYSVCALCRGS